MSGQVSSRSSFFRRSAPLAAALVALLTAVAPAGAQGLPGPSYAGAETVPSGSKPQSKLWWNHGRWWGCLWSVDAQAFTIHALHPSDLTWLDTLVAIDSRPKSRADVLWDGAKLYVASHRFTGGIGTPGDPLKLYRYSYDPAQGRYSLDVGFPTLIGDSKTEALVIDKDSLGRLWAVWRAGNRVWTAHTLGDDRDWSAPAVHPASTSDIAEDDLASVVAFAGHVGVMWSDQVLDRFVFTTHADGDPVNTWSPLEVVLSGPQIAEDQICLRAHPDGRVFATLRTNTDEVRLAVRALDGTWSDHLVASEADDWDRPTLVIDEQADEVHVFGTTPANGGAIHTKKSPCGAPAFAAGVGTAVIRDPGAPEITDATTTKNPVRGETGLLVVACHEGNQTYVYGVDGLGGSTPFPPLARFFADPKGEYGPLRVQFHDASQGFPQRHLWSFGDGALSLARHPVHRYRAPGVYTVSLQVSNALGSDVRTRVGLIEVSDVPTSLVLRPIGDAQAYQGSPSSNQGGLESLRVRGGRDSDYRSFMKFFVPPMPADVLSAELQLYSIDGSPDGGDVHRVSDAWEEPTLTWNTMPALDTPVLGNFGHTQPDTILLMDVGAAVEASGTVSFGIANSDYHSQIFSSREGFSPPELRLELAPRPLSVSRAAFEFDRLDGTVPLVVQFSDASNGRVEAWHWEFGDGETSDLQNPSHLYRHPGRYLVTLTVTGVDGSIGTSTPGMVRVRPR